MDQWAHTALLCPIRDTGLREVSKLTGMLATALQGASANLSASDYLSGLAEAKAIRLHLTAVRESLAKHRKDHGC
jgi:hypothetical protein